LEIITAEQMMDAYASVGMPVNYRHWSYGKEFIATEKNYRRGHWVWPMKSSSTPTRASAT
jgi:stage V sporulation protein R